VSSQIARLRGQRGLRGQALRSSGCHGQRGHQECDTQSCNQLKPQTAAVYASHVYLLQ
jgi:hypothetical protein